MTVASRVCFIVLLGVSAFFVTSSNSPSIATEPEKEQGETVKPNSELQRVARLTVANELMRLHWASWVSGKELRQIASTTAEEINGQLENRAEVEFLLPEVRANSRKLEPQEKQAVKDIRAGVAEVWRNTEDGIQYVSGIRATTTCIQCHQPSGSPRSELSQGDLLGIISLKIKR